MQLHSFLYRSSETKTSIAESFQGDSIDLFLQEMKIDIENLLNARRQPFLLPPHLRELDLSVLKYGIEDFSGNFGFSESNLEKLASDIEKTLGLYENRLVNLKVSPVASEKDNKRVVLFRIEGEMSFDEKTVSVFSHLNLHIRPQTYSLHDWSFDHGG